MAKGIGDVIYNLLSNNASVSAIVGNKIFPYLAQDDATTKGIVAPYIVYEKVGLDPTDDKDGVSQLDVLSINIELYAEIPSDLEALNDAVRDVLDRYSGTVETIVIQSITYLGQEGGYADLDRIFMIIQRYNVRQIK